MSALSFLNERAELFIPAGDPVDRALTRTTHLAIGAHQDDLEIMAVDGILACFQQDDQWFSGVVVTDGAGSPRASLYADTTDEAMRRIRSEEQKKAAVIGEYSAMAMLGYPSRAVKDASDRRPMQDLALLLQASQPAVVYTHNLADKHPTHVAVALRTIAAIRSLPASARPQHLYGCEVWRSLDWMLEQDRIVFDCSSRQGLQLALLGVFDSQISGGKRYDLATMARRRAQATYDESHGIDVRTGVAYAMELTPLIEDPSLDVVAFVAGFLDRFSEDVRRSLVQSLERGSVG
jgi:LmbE family N-acetylglucosaminyl deacetylase